MCSTRSMRVKSQRGVALLIAIFALLLISGAAIGMIVMSGTESAINANYRRSTMSFYGASAGLEEARERMVPCSPYSFWPATACANPPVSNDILFNDNPVSATVGMLYITNPGAGDPAGFNPILMAPTHYLADTTLAGEYAVVPPPVQKPGSPMAPSAIMTAGGQGPMDYKWVRITLKTERMAGVDIDGNGILDEIMPVRVDGTGRQCLPSMAGCAFNPNAPVTTRPVYRVTAKAVSATGESRILQAEMSQLPIINPNGAIASEAGVSINGNFNAFGAWPPIVQETCGSGKAQTTGPTCGTMSKGAVVGDCNQPYSNGGTPNDPSDDTCGGQPKPFGDYCNQGTAVSTVTSAGGINPSGNYDTVPDAGSACTSGGSGCISTVDPNQALVPNMPNWPYDMDQIINQLKPPVTKPIQQVDSSTSCGPYDLNGNRTCTGSNTQLGTLPSPWPPPPGTAPTNFTPELTYADVGPGGTLKLTAANSVGSGVLVVEGDLEVTGGLSFYGIIIVRGTVKFLGGGSTGVNVIGGILAGSSVTNVSSSTTVGGSVAVTYSSCAFRYNNQAMPLRYLSFREVTQ